MQTFLQRPRADRRSAIVGVVLLLGLWNMMRGGSTSTSQNLMRARVVAQFAAIVIIMAALWFMGR